MNMGSGFRETFMLSSNGKSKIILGIILIVVLIIAGYLFYLYQRGSKEYYRPPLTKAESSRTQVVDDLTTLSQAIDAYYSKNLKYPEKLEELVPEFIDIIPVEPGTGKPFVYEPQGIHHYRIVISNPTPGGLKELVGKNGNTIRN